MRTRAHSHNAKACCHLWLVACCKLIFKWFELDWYYLKPCQLNISCSIFRSAVARLPAFNSIGNDCQWVGRVCVCVCVACAAYFLNILIETISNLWVASGSRAQCYVMHSIAISALAAYFARPCISFVYGNYFVGFCLCVCVLCWAHSEYINIFAMQVVNDLS